METTDNRKIILTNRTAITFVVAIVTLTFGATKFYDETRYQQLVSQQNKEQIHHVEQAVREFSEQEILGLRADWERDRLEQNKRLEKLEKNCD